MRLHIIMLLWCWIICLSYVEGYLRIVGVKKEVNGRGTLVSSMTSSELVDIGPLGKVYQSISRRQISIPQATKKVTIDKDNIYYIIPFSGNKYIKSSLLSIISSTLEESSVTVNINNYETHYNIVDAYKATEIIYNNHVAISSKHIAIKDNPICAVDWNTFNSKLLDNYKACVYLPLVNILGIIHIKGNIQINIPNDVQEYMSNGIIHASCSDSKLMIVDILNNLRWTYLNYGIATHLLRQIDVIPQISHTVMKDDIQCITFQLGINAKPKVSIESDSNLAAESELIPPSTNDLIKAEEINIEIKQDKPRSQEEPEEDSKPKKEESKPKEEDKPKKEEPKKEEPKPEPNLTSNPNAYALCLINMIRAKANKPKLRGSYALDAASINRSQMQAEIGVMTHNVCKTNNGFKANLNKDCKALWEYLRTLTNGVSGENISVQQMARFKEEPFDSNCDGINVKHDVKTSQDAINRAVYGWCHSSGHYNNIVGDHAYVGFGTVSGTWSGRQSWYSTQLFGNKNHKPNKMYDEQC